MATSLKFFPTSILTDLASQSAGISSDIRWGCEKNQITCKMCEEHTYVVSWLVQYTEYSGSIPRNACFACKTWLCVTTVNLDISASIYFCEFKQKAYRFIFVLLIFANSFKCWKLICVDTLSIVLILCKFKMKFSIGMQWTQKQTILIYIIIILQFKSIACTAKCKV